MKILGALVYIAGFLGFAYIVEETRIIESFGGFGGTVFIFVWWLVTIVIGSALMKSGDINGK